MIRTPPSSAPLLVTYVGLIGLAILIFVLARNFPAAHMGAASPGFFPQVVAVVLLLLSIAGIVEVVRDPPERTHIPRRVLAAMALSLGYIGAMAYVGYYPSTFVFAALVMWLSRDGAGLPRVVMEAAVLVAFSYLFFELLISAYLPTGLLFD